MKRDFSERIVKLKEMIQCLEEWIKETKGVAQYYKNLKETVEEEKAMKSIRNMEEAIRKFKEEIDEYEQRLNYEKELKKI